MHGLICAIGCMVLALAPYPSKLIWYDPGPELVLAYIAAWPIWIAGCAFMAAIRSNEKRGGKYEINQFQ